VVVSGDTTFFALIGKMNEAHSRLAVVLAAKAHEEGAPSVSGVVTRADVAEALVEGMDIFAD
jgi:CBS domain-containing protein